MALPILYNVRHLAARRTATLMTALGIALVVFIFIWFLALSNGFKKALVSTGRPDNLIVTRSGATSEVQSGLSREDAAILLANPAIAKAGDGAPIASAEMVAIASIPKDDGSPANVTIRGVSPRALSMRPFVRVTEGRLPGTGLAEVIVGKSLSKRFGNLDVGGVVHFGRDPWNVVGIFDAGGTAFESEIWGDPEVLLPALQKDNFQSLTLRLADPARAEAVITELEAEPRMRVQVHTEREYYSNQSGMLALMFSTMGTFIAIVISFGAVFGALNTMYAAVDQRTREIATLRAIGFSPFSIYISFVMESVLIALLGGAMGALLALPFNGLSTGTTNWASFSEIAFQFQVSPPVIFFGLVFAAFLGVAGGMLPAWKAARRPVSAALRAGV